MPLLKLVNVSKIYQLEGITVPALNNINFEIKEKDFLSIMGPSGSGKSTLMHLAGCLDTPTFGNVFFNNKDISKLNEEELAKIRNREIGFVFQSYNLIPRVSALNNVALPLIYAGISAKERMTRSIAALKNVGLEKRLYHFPNQLSGGEQQRVAIARALINQPKLILADEPTGNLDTKSSNEIMKIFAYLNKQGNTIVIVTHEEEIGRQTKKIIRIRDGKIIIQ